jgi:uncharacterized BrkB/YihY/UPF0761 family membrane protein
VKTALTVVFQLVTVLQLVSAIILADALRRIHNSLKQNPFLVANEKIMWLHVLMLVVNVAVLSVTSFFSFRAIDVPDNTTYQI